MTKYEIIAKSGERISGCGIVDVQIFVKANNHYYVFDSSDGETVNEPRILKNKSVNIPLGNWFFVENFEAEDFAKYPEFMEAIEKYFEYN